MLLALILTIDNLSNMTFEVLSVKFDSWFDDFFLLTIDSGFKYDRWTIKITWYVTENGNANWKEKHEEVIK